MARNIVTREILDVGLIPVIRASSSAEAIAIAKAIEAGGVSVCGSNHDSSTSTS